jgi:hypothetical protein
MSYLNPNAAEFIPNINNISFVFTPIEDPPVHLLEYPFSYISGYLDNNLDANYDINDFCEGILGENPCNPENFPKNITKFYWIHEGTNDDEAWMCMCKLSNECYVFYTASCDYTGFDCQGGMNMIISKNLYSLFYEGMTEQQRQMCIRDKRSA